MHFPLVNPTVIYSPFPDSNTRPGNTSNQQPDTRQTRQSGLKLSEEWSISVYIKIVVRNIFRFYNVIWEDWGHGGDEDQQADWRGHPSHLLPAQQEEGALLPALGQDSEII